MLHLKMKQERGLNMLVSLKNKRLNKKNALLLSGVVVGFTIIIWLIVSYVFLDEYREYKNSSKSDKNAGKIVHYLNEEDDILQSFFYPHFTYEVLNTKIEDLIEQYKQNKDGHYIHHVDYKSNVVYDQYYTVKLNYRILDKTEKEVKNTFTYINYDAKADKVMKIDDIFRVTYKQEILDVIGRQAQQELTSEHLESFELQEHQILFYIEGKEISIPYEEYKKYIVLSNENIPTLAPKGIIVEEKKVIDPNKPMIAFTFDDGPSSVHTPRILDTLKKYEASATFFMLGQNIEKNTDLLKRMVREGHEVANHSFDHTNLAELDVSAIKQQLNSTQDLIFHSSGVESKLMRPPYGAISETLRNTTPIPMVLWSIDSLDWKLRNVEAIKAEVLPYIKDGSVILLHDIYGTTAQAFEEMMPILKEQGYQFVTVSQLYEHRPERKKLDSFS